MPTNDERREVAEDMRCMARDTLSGYSFQRAVESVVFGQLGNKTWRQILSRLADLIEPSERTCRNVNPVSCRNFICSECDRSYDKGAGEPNPIYCPNCGAKVIE